MSLAIASLSSNFANTWFLDTESPTSTLICFIFPGISKASFDCSKGSSLPGNSLVIEYEFKILTSSTSIEDILDETKIPNKIIYLKFLKFDIVL